jgi:hypothetical protein
MRKFVITFSELEPNSTRWTEPTDETFEDRSKANDRFFKAVKVAKNSNNSIHIVMFESDTLIEVANFKFMVR